MKKAWIVLTSSTVMTSEMGTMFWKRMRVALREGRESTFVHLIACASYSPERNETVEGRDRRGFSSGLEEVGRAVVDLIEDAVGDGAADTESHEDDKVDENVEVGLLLDLGALRRGVAWGREQTGEVSSSERDGQETNETYLG